MNILKALSFTFGFFLTILPLSSYAQCTRTSNNGKYTVDILLTSVDVVNISANPCPNGYSLNISIDYIVSITGTQPQNLYTCQGDIQCTNIPGSPTGYFNLPNNGGSGNVEAATMWNSNTDCATATPASLACDVAYVQLKGPSMPDGIIDCPMVHSPLSINLGSSLIYVNNEEDVIYQWSTLQEKNSAYFIVEHTADGESWEVIDSLPAQGQSEEEVEYRVSHKDSKCGLNFYKLKEIDLNGDTNLVDLAHVKKMCKKGIRVIPNPTNSDFRVIGLHPNDEFLALVGSTGQRISRERYFVEQKEKGFHFNIENLESGVYYLEFTEGKRVKVIKT